MEKGGYIYILTNKSNKVLYTGVTSSLERRISQHQSLKILGFTSKYKVTKLLHYEFYNRIEEAIAREKYIKNKKRSWKVALIKLGNPNFIDLSLDPSLRSG